MSSADDNLIPCEFCDEMIAFDDYEEHLEECASRREHEHLARSQTQMQTHTLQRVQMMYNDPILGLVNLDATEMLAILQGHISRMSMLGGSNGDASSNNELVSNGEDNGSNNPQALASTGQMQVPLPQGQLAGLGSNASRFAFVLFSEPEEIEMNDYEFNTMLGELIGHVSKGVTDFDAVCKEIAGEEVKDAAAEDACPICQETIMESCRVSEEEQVGEEAKASVLARPCVKTLCGHVFCKDCLSTWLSKHTKCPLCMLDLEDEVAKLAKDDNETNEPIEVERC